MARLPVLLLCRTGSHVAQVGPELGLLDRVKAAQGTMVALTEPGGLAEEDLHAAAGGKVKVPAPGCIG